MEADIYYLGKLCPKEHNYKNTGKSLKYKSNHTCKECSLILQGQRENSRSRIYPFKNDPKPEGVFIPSNHYLGLLCKRKHDYSQTGHSLRNTSRSCVECVLLKSRSTRSKQRTKSWRNTNPGYMPNYLREYYLQNKDRISLQNKEYSKTPKGKFCKKIGRHKRRARLNQSERIPYTSKELMLHFQQHDNQCVYCGSEKNLTADHVVAIAKGGRDALDNILPCCLSCNCSKQDKDYLDWYLKSQHFNVDRFIKITNFLNLIYL